MSVVLEPCLPGRKWVCRADGVKPRAARRAEVES